MKKFTIIIFCVFISIYIVIKFIGLCTGVSYSTKGGNAYDKPGSWINIVLDSAQVAEYVSYLNKYLIEQKDITDQDNHNRLYTTCSYGPGKYGDPYLIKSGCRGDSCYSYRLNVIKSSKTETLLNQIEFTVSYWPDKNDRKGVIWETIRFEHYPTTGTAYLTYGCGYEDGSPLGWFELLHESLVYEKFDEVRKKF